MHGIGLKRVKKTVEKFNGTFKYYTEDSDEESCFIAEAMLYLWSIKDSLSFEMAK